MESKTPSAPHACPNCGEPAYVGGPGFPAQCTSRPCPFYSEDCWARWVLELSDPGDPEPDDESRDSRSGITWVSPYWTPHSPLDLPTLDDLLPDLLDDDD